MFLHTIYTTKSAENCLFPRTGNPVASDMEGRRMCVVHHKKEDGRMTLESKTMRSHLIREELSGGMDGG
jgi:hypothetical protein